MKNYDPNIYDGTHTIRATFQQWDYVGHVTFERSGNCHGATLLSCDFLDNDNQEDIDRYVENDCGLIWDEDSEIYIAVLRNSQGDTLEVDGDPEEIKDMVVSIEFIDYKENKPRQNLFT